MIACFLPWAYYPDLKQEFTGFVSYGNAYGKPGKVLFFFSILSICFFIIPRIWAKRANIIVGALVTAFSVKTYLLYVSCYRGTCPSPRVGIFIVVAAALLMTVAAILPNMPIKEEKH